MNEKQKEEFEEMKRVESEKLAKMNPIRREFFLKYNGKKKTPAEMLDVDFLEKASPEILKEYVTYVENLQTSIMVEVMEAGKRTQLMQTSIMEIIKIIAKTPGNHPVLKAIYEIVIKASKVEVKYAESRGLLKQ